VGVYKEKVESKIKKLADEHPTIKKIKKNDVLSEEDLQKLENTLNSPDLYITEKTLQEVYQQHKGTLVEFIKKILGLYEFPNPEKRIAEEFKTFVVEHNFMNADQINFVRTLQTVFTKKKHIEYKDFFDAPFTNFGVDAPVPLFTEDQLNQMVTLCKHLAKEVFA
jgi:type I restriction enzyme R subunit